MEDVRREIDRVDRQLVRLLAERQAYVEQAGRIKGDRRRVRDEGRIDDVLRKIRAAAESEGLESSLAEPLWRLLIEKSIEHEYEVFDAQRRTAAGSRLHP